MHTRNILVFTIIIWPFDFFAWVLLFLFLHSYNKCDLNLLIVQGRTRFTIESNVHGARKRPAVESCAAFLPMHNTSQPEDSARSLVSQIPSDA